MKHLVAILLLAAIVALVSIFLVRTQSDRHAPEEKMEGVTRSLENEPVQQLPLMVKLDEEKVVLGEKLFNEPQLSHDDTISCSSCHSLSLGGTDQRVRSIGIEKRVGSVNAPTVFNSGFNFKQFWDGRAETLEDQIDGPIAHPSEMGSNWTEITNKLKASPEYRAEFAKLYAAGIQSDTIKDAIATFERSLSTPNSRFDKFLQGDVNALSAEEGDGYRLFKNYGCSSCHQGVNAGGNMFQKFGAMGDYFANRGNPTKADLGRFNVTNNDTDRYVFKVPSLRNVGLTAPYFHDGAAASLEDAVAIMAKYQLGRRLSSEEIHQIVSFLNTLSGEYKGKAL